MQLALSLSKICPSLLSFFCRFIYLLRLALFVTYYYKAKIHWYVSECVFIILLLLTAI